MENKEFIFPEYTYGRKAEEYFLDNEDPYVKERFPRIWVRNIYYAFINLTRQYINSYNQTNAYLPYDCYDTLKFVMRFIHCLMIIRDFL